jgi:hypothetical protein
VRLADPEVLRSKQRTLETQDQLNEATQALQQLYEHWSEACELNG